MMEQEAHDTRLSPFPLRRLLAFSLDIALRCIAACLSRRPVIMPLGCDSYLASSSCSVLQHPADCVADCSRLKPIRQKRVPTPTACHTATAHLLGYFSPSGLSLSLWLSACSLCCVVRLSSLCHQGPATTPPMQGVCRTRLVRTTRSFLLAGFLDHWMLCNKITQV